jgi:ATP-dependent Lon protease
MTGEITLRGNVLAVGGIKEKVLAAARAGVQEVILPERNQKDLEEIPEEIRKALTFHFVSTMDSVLELALEPAGASSEVVDTIASPEPEHKELVS